MLPLQTRVYLCKQLQQHDDVATPNLATHTLYASTFRSQLAPNDYMQFVVHRHIIEIKPKWCS
jgi:hypothetical protein